ncbi:MAG: acyl-CoA ligase (AMP-forming), exosortase A system-associated [Proteobacteria bacterium]|nr:acyl-CoA ligase (AMP-forming), exosortase A system-associated [Pseudomonadota bacterium]
MSQLLFELPLQAAARAPTARCLHFRGRDSDYASLAHSVDRCAAGLLRLGLARQERVAVYLPKQPETVHTMFGAARAGCVFVPVNPLLKPPQVAHILRDCNVRVLVTSADRAAALAEVLAECPDLRVLVSCGEAAPPPPPAPHIQVLVWRELAAPQSLPPVHRVIDTDVASIFYTSGSTGKPKGVVLSHRNMVAGAHSVAQYLENTPDDRLLAVLPLSFDYGFSQLSTAFHVGASVILMDYLLPRDVINQAARERATGLAGVPPLWSQLADLEWPQAARESLRYITNSGGHMPRATLAKLRAALPGTQPFLMYGLTEAFRSTYLPPSQLDQRPESMGKAIPNAEIMVVRPDGSRCAPDEPGELVHRGALVSLGYWNDPQKTAERFKPCPGQDPALVLTELAVWSGDTVRMDADGFLYFVGRRDEMIKTSGYRVSPGEVEEVVFATGQVADAAAVGVPHPRMGQAIIVVAAAAPGQGADSERLLAQLRAQLPAFMVPQHVIWRVELPRNPNGKYDRPRLAEEVRALFNAEGELR